MIRALYQHYIDHLDAFRTIYCQSQLRTASAVRPDQQTIREEVHPRTRQLFDVLEKRLVTAEMSKAQRAGARRLAFSAWLSAVGLLTMLGVADSTNDPLAHKDDDLVSTLADTFDAAALALA